jgi:hypothetical protein
MNNNNNNDDDGLAFWDTINERPLTRHEIFHYELEGDLELLKEELRCVVDDKWFDCSLKKPYNGYARLHIEVYGWLIKGLPEYIKRYRKEGDMDHLKRRKFSTVKSARKAFS